MSAYSNQVTIIGNLCKVVEVRETTSGSVCNFTIAVYRNGKGDSAITDFINCVAWNDLARGMANVAKGSKLIVVGSIATRSYEVDGVKKYAVEVSAREIGLDISVKKDEEENQEEIPF
jgi:single-strand DNA-binding protein